MSVSTLVRSATKITLPGRALGAAWLNCALASSTDETRPVLYRTLLVEVFDTGVQLVATDSYMILGAFVPTESADLTPPPSIDEAPNASYVVVDPDKRMLSLMRYVHDDAKAAEKANLEPLTVALSTSSGESRDVPTLDPSLDRAMFVAEVNNERLALPIYEGEYPNWRAFIAGHKPAATGGLLLSAALLGRFGKLKDFSGAISMSFAGESGLIVLSSPGDESYMFGGLMPITGPGGAE